MFLASLALPGEPPGSLLGPPGGILGASRGVLRRLGASWGALEASWRHFGPPKKPVASMGTGSAFKRKPDTTAWGTSRTIDEKIFEKSLGIILETPCTAGNTYSELRRFAAHSRERGCPHANASWSVSVRPKIPPRAPPKLPKPFPNATKTPQNSP